MYVKKSRRTALTLALPLALVISLVVVGYPSDAAAKLKVVATLSDLGALAKEIGGPHVHVTTLVPHDADAHYIDARPNLMLPLSRADLVIVNGLQLEVGWLPPLIRNSRNGKIQAGTPGYLAASFFVRRLQVPTQKVSRVMGDVHPGGNPHFTHDPRAGIAISKAIARRLSALDPAHAKDYAARQSAWAKRATKLVNTQAQRFAKLPAAKRVVVSYHQSLAYLFDWLKLKEIATIEPRPGIPPNPGHTANVLSKMRATGARTIVTEPYYPQTVSKTLARLAKGTLVKIPGGTRLGKGETYLQRIKRTSDALYAAIAKTHKAGK